MGGNYNKIQTKICCLHFLVFQSSLSLKVKTHPRRRSQNRLEFLMPTFTAIALENLLEPRVAESLKKPHVDGRSRHLYISPALYATPEQSPIPDYSFRDPPSPSPYVANHKRRGGGNVRVPETESFNLDEEEEEKCLIECVDSVPEEDEECFDPRIQVDSSDFSQIQTESRSFVSAQGEFFDAIDGIIQLSF